MNWHCIYRVALTLLVTTVASAGEWRLQRDARPTGSLVTLSDVVESASLADSGVSTIELFPTPAPGQTRLVRRQQVSDLLLRRGIDLRGISWAGADAVTIHGPQAIGRDESDRSATVATPYLAVSAIKELLIRATADYLRKQSGEDTSWQIELEANTNLWRQLQGVRGPMVVSGGMSPWTGQQSFQLQTFTNVGPFDCNFIAHVTKPHTVVVVHQAVRRNEVISPAAVTIEELSSNEVTSQMITSIDLVVGQQAKRSLAPGQRVLTSYIQPMKLVSRGDIVTVFARTSGFQIRTKAKVLSDGGKNDIVPLESLLDGKKQFTARVVGSKEVEIFTAGPVNQRVSGRVLKNTPRYPTRDVAVEATRPSAFALKVRPTTPARR